MTDFQFSDALKDIGQIITVLDVSGKVLYVNRVVPGIDISKFIGSQIYRWLPENTSKIIKKNLKEIIITKSELEFEDEIIDPTGITHYYANRMTPIIRDNVVDGVTIVTNETTALKKLKSQLARSQDIAALSLNTLEIGIWDWDIRTRTVEMDDMSYKIFGWQRAEFDNSIDTFLNEIFHPEDVDALLLQSRFGPSSKFGSGDKDSSENQLVQGGKIRFIRGYDKEVRWIKYRAKSFFNEDDELIRTLGIGWDVTDHLSRKEVKQQSIALERQNGELKEFAHLASHDLKAPLRTLKSYSDLLSNRYSDQLDDKANKYLQFIGEAAVDMDNQIKELLNYSLVGQHKDAEWVNCNELVNHILTKLSNTISATDTKVVVQPLPTILAYATDMSTLFQNLISNALKFYSKARKLVISISVIEIEDSWKFEIKDNGIGIDEKYLTKIFAIFERLNNKEEFAGTGIGLAHCRKIVELHGGKIWAKSKLGEGSSFFFTIKNLSNSVTPSN